MSIYTLKSKTTVFWRENEKKKGKGEGKNAYFFLRLQPLLRKRKGKKREE